MSMSRDNYILSVLIKAGRPMRVEELANRLGARRRRPPQSARIDMAQASCRRLIRDRLVHKTADGRYATGCGPH